MNLYIHTDINMDTYICIYVHTYISMYISIYDTQVRYNLIVDGLCSDKWAVFYSVVLPFAGSWVFYRGSAFNDVVYIYIHV